MGVEGVSNSDFAVMPSDYSTSNVGGTSALGKDEFLNLLVTQLQYQDPLEPSSDTEFIAQMAQFSSLEQMQNLNDSFSKFQSFSMVGKYVTANYGTDTIEGYVENVVTAGGETFAVIDGNSVNIEDIYKITDMAEELQVLTNILQQLVTDAENSKNAEANKESAVVNGLQGITDILQKMSETDLEGMIEEAVEEAVEDIIPEE